MLLAESELRIIGDSGSVEEVVALTRRRAPDVIFVDSGLRGMRALDLSAELGKLSPDSKLVVVAEELTSDAVSILAQPAVRGYLLWSRLRVVTLKHCLAAVLVGGLCVSTPDVFQAVAGRNTGRRSLEGKLTEHERAVLKDLLTGKKEREIADVQRVGLRTIQDTIQRLKQKLRAPTLFMLGARAHELGFEQSKD